MSNLSCSDYVSDNKPVPIQTEGTSDLDLGLMEWLGVPLVLGCMTTLAWLICCLDTAVHKINVLCMHTNVHEQLVTATYPLPLVVPSLMKTQ